jgi:hypothetical protein
MVRVYCACSYVCWRTEYGHELPIELEFVAVLDHLQMGTDVMRPPLKSMRAAVALYAWHCMHGTASVKH